MKKLGKILSGIAFTLAVFLVAGCADHGSSSSKKPSTSNSSSSSSVGGNSSSSTGGNMGTALQRALAADYSNVTMGVALQYMDAFGSIESETFTEYNYKGYTIIKHLYVEDDSPDYLFYHDYQGESYLYFEDRYGNGDAWLNKGLYDKSLSLENTYFSTRMLQENVKAEDATYQLGAYFIDNPTVIAKLEQTVFRFAWDNEIDYVAIVVNNDKIYQIIGGSDYSDDIYVVIQFADVGTTLFYDPILPEAPNENNVKTYYEWSGTQPSQDVLISSLTVDFVDDEEDGTIEIEESIEIERQYLPENATRTSVTWVSSDPSVASVNYSFTAGQAIVKGLKAGTTEVYAVFEHKNTRVESNHLTITVNPVKTSELENRQYQLVFANIDNEGKIAAVNQLLNGKTVTAKGNKATIASAANGTNQFNPASQLLVLNPSQQGGDNQGAYVAFDFGLQQVSGISFYYGLQWESHYSNLSWLQKAEIQISNDGMVWTTAHDILDEIKSNISGSNIKLMEKEFAPSTHVRVLFYCNMVGKLLSIATEEMNFYCNEQCVEVPGEDDVVPVSSIEISTLSSTELEVGDKIQFSAVVNPNDATDSSVVWQSSNPVVASINAATGELEALAAGSTSVTAVSTDGSVTSNEITVSVAEKTVIINLPSNMNGVWAGKDIYDVDVTITIDIAEKTLRFESEDYDLTFAVKSYDDVNKNYTFESEEGYEITVGLPNGYTNYLEVSCEFDAVYIDATMDENNAFVKQIEVTSVYVSAPNNKTTLEVGDSVTLTAKIYPVDANVNTKVTWKSSDTAVAEITSGGKVTAKAAGTTEVTATAANGTVSNILTITVNAPATSGGAEDIAAFVGTWETEDGDMDYDIYGTVILTINEDGSAELDVSNSVQYSDATVQLTYKSHKDNVYTFEDEYGDEFIFTYNPDSQTATFEYESSRNFLTFSKLSNYVKS